MLGGTGFFGSLLVDDLLEHTDLDVTVVSRRGAPQKRYAHNPRVTHVRTDLRDKDSLRRTAMDHGLIVHAAGPFELLPLEPLDVAIDLRVDYIDISENRLFRQAVLDREGRIADAGIHVLSGFSVVPGMSALMTRIVAPHFDRLQSVRTFAAPDTRRHRGRAMFRTTLYGAGRPFRTVKDGRPSDATGWSEPEWVEFPPPAGRVLTYLVFGMADLDLLPPKFGVKTVEFKAGCEHPFLNRLLSGAGSIRRRLPIPLERLGPIVRGISWLAGRFGRGGGAAMFEITGVRDGALTTDVIAIVSNTDGEEIPVTMAGVASEAWERKELPHPGIVDSANWIDPNRFIIGLEARDLGALIRVDGNSRWTELHEWLNKGRATNA